MIGTVEMELLYLETLWLKSVTFFQLEKTFGDTKHIRRAFQRALERVKDDPVTISEAWYPLWPLFEYQLNRSICSLATYVLPRSFLNILI